MPRMDPTEVVEAKRAWRAAVRTARRGRAARPGREAADQRIAGAGLALVAAVTHGRGCRVGAYAARPTEPPTAALVEGLRRAGHHVLLPVTCPERTLEWDCDGVRLPPAALGSAAVVFTPGLAVDVAGRRLGQGGGYYDAALRHVPATVPVLTLLWDEELVEGPLPVQAHDRRVDGVLTPGGGVRWVRDVTREG